jgi:hypothetical protein
MTVTIILITTSQLVMFGFPDIWIFLNPNKTAPNIFFLMNLNKGIIFFDKSFISGWEVQGAAE